MNTLARIRHGIVAGFGSAVTAYGAATVKGPVSAVEWGAIIGAAVVVGVATYFARPTANDQPNTSGSAK